jgi:predicted dehydrogenase
MKYQQEHAFAIVGCGLIGQKRARTLPDSFLKLTCDLDLARAEALASTIAGCKATSDLNEILSDSDVDVVIVSAPNTELAPITEAVVRQGKHVLVEKPGAIFSRELSAIESIACETGSLVRIGYNHRYHPAFRKIGELGRDEDFGEFMFLRARYGHGGRPGYEREWRANPKLSGGGELIDQGVHLIDLASLWLGDTAQVAGYTATYYWDMPVDDNAFVSLRDARGRTAWLHASCTEWKNLFSFEIYFKRAKLHVEGLGGSYGVERLYYYKMLPEMGPPETIIYEFPRGDQSWRLELDEFLEDIRIGRTPIPGLKEGIRTLEIVEDIYRKSGYQF